MYINNIKHQISQTAFHNNICYGTYFLACDVKCLVNTSYVHDLMNDMFQMRIHTYISCSRKYSQEFHFTFRTSRKLSHLKHTCPHRRFNVVFLQIQLIWLWVFITKKEGWPPIKKKYFSLMFFNFWILNLCMRLR